jgi:hypothetical protein
MPELDLMRGSERRTRPVGTAPDLAWLERLGRKKGASEFVRTWLIRKREQISW